MPTDKPEDVHLHVHLPDRPNAGGMLSQFLNGDVDERPDHLARHFAEAPRQDHVHLYLHTTAHTMAGVAAALEPRPGRPVLKALAAVVLLGLATEAGYHFGSKGGEAGAMPARAAVAMAPDAGAAVPQMPPALAHELAQPPSIIPPPGSAGASGPASGPSAFGLGN
jgi:hypothetical protein